MPNRKIISGFEVQLTGEKAEITAELRCSAEHEKLDRMREIITRMSVQDAQLTERISHEAKTRCSAN